MAITIFSSPDLSKLLGVFLGKLNLMELKANQNKPRKTKLPQSCAKGLLIV